MTLSRFLRRGLVAPTAMGEEAVARGCVIAALLLALFVNQAFLVSNTVFGGDDWAWIWTFHTYGAGTVQHYLSASGHPGFGPVLNLLLYLGGDQVGRLAHIFMIVFHLASGWLIWCVFREARCAPPLAATMAVLYLASPYLAGLHGSLAHAQYDFSIFCYLLSIWLSLHENWSALAAALVAALLGLSIETLMALEPLRWWALARKRPDLASGVRAALPFIALALLVGLAREFWFVPSGPYAGYNSVSHAGIGAYIGRATSHIAFLANFGQPLVFTVRLMGHDNPFFPWTIFAGAVVASFTLWRSDHVDNRDLLLFFIVGAMVLALGMAPYVAIDETPSRIDVASRFAVASQFGALMIIAGGIQLVRFAPLRGAALAGLTFILMANQLQLGKWLLYEGQVIDDFRRQTATYLAHAGDQMLVVDFAPASREFLYLNRACLGSYDTNVSLELAHGRGGSFVYDGGCPYRYFGNPEGCFITGFDPPSPCPADERRATFRLKPDLGPFTNFHLGDLLKRTISGPALHAGDLTPSP